MQAHPAQQGQWIGYAITVAIVLVVMALRLRRAGRMRRLRLETLWVVPALYLAMTLATFVATPPAGTARAYVAAGLAAGCCSAGSAAG